MDNTDLNLHELQAKTSTLQKNTGKPPLSEVFNSDLSEYINENALFSAYFNSIPNLLIEPYIKTKEANDWFLANFRSEIKDVYYYRRFYKKAKGLEYSLIYYLLCDDLLLSINLNGSSVRIYYRNTPMEKVNAVMEGIQKFREKVSRKKPMVSLLVTTLAGIETKSLEVTKPKISIHENYNDDFKEVHQTIVKRLSKKNDKGIVLLHGKPGTGKTSYIRYLIATLKKEVIFLPPNMAGAITNPNLISILIDNPGSIFVIEDAENIVVDRNSDGDSPVSALLNISDGLLSDCLNIQVICSFNTDISKVDSALMRKGRLIAKYEFKELEVEKARNLSEKLGFTTQINAPMALTSIYNQDEMDFKPRQISQIGFSFASN